MLLLFLFFERYEGKEVVIGCCAIDTIEWRVREKANEGHKWMSTLPLNRFVYEFLFLDTFYVVMASILLENGINV